MTIILSARGTRALIHLAFCHCQLVASFPQFHEKYGPISHFSSQIPILSPLFLNFIISLLVRVIKCL